MPLLRRSLRKKEIFAIGDTIIIYSSFPKILQDLSPGGELINYSNSLGIKGPATFYELDTVSRQVRFAVMKFDFIADSGMIDTDGLNPEQKLNLGYFETAGKYTFKIRIIPGIEEFLLFSFRMPEASAYQTKTVQMQLFQTP